MGYKVLYRKYRPINFENIVGQEYVVRMLRSAIVSGHHSHAYIFTGPRGTGKTSSAKVFAKAINCENPKDGSPCNECSACLSFCESPDIIEIDAASNNGVDEIRELINSVKLVPSSLRYKVYIIDEVHMLTTSAFNALLLTLEEPPEHVVFILATTDIQNVPITILSRCQRFDFKPIVLDEIVNRLRYICDEEGIKASGDALKEIALVSAGGMRDALGMLDQLAADKEEVSLEMVTSYFGSVSLEKIKELIGSIFIGDSDKLVAMIEEIRSFGVNYSVFVEKLISELRNIAILVKSGKYEYDVAYSDIVSMVLDLNECLSNVNINVDPYVLIEIVLLKYVSSDEDNKKRVVINNSKEKNENDLGNSLEKNAENSGNKEVLDSKNAESLSNEEVSETYSAPVVKIDLEVRINNTFVGASKKYKSDLGNKWVDFLNYLMSHDRSLMSLLVDVEILAVSDCYALIQGKQESINDLINASISKLESLYKEYSGTDYRFAAINENLWKKEVEKYRFNLKNKIKYTYMDEECLTDSESDSASKLTSDVEDMEELVKSVFDSYEVK